MTVNQNTDEPRFATVTAEGVSYEIYLTSPGRDYIQKNLASKGVPYELAMLTDMKSRLTADGTVLDVGANIGNHTFYLAQVLGCRVVAFEANDELAHAMDITANEAGLEERVTVHAFGLGDKPGFAEFEKSIPDNLGGQSLRKGRGRIKIRTLDSFGITEPVTAIKVDVEGMELDVLRGGKRLIEKNLPMLYIESQTKESFGEISSYLGALDYCYRDTFNATPTHLFIHRTKLQNEASMDLSTLHRVEHEYDLLVVNNKVKKDLVDCQMKYREVCQFNSQLKSDYEQLQQQIQANQDVCSQADMEQRHVELDQTKEKLVDAERQIDRLKGEVVKERNEKEFHVRQNSQKYFSDKLDSALQEKLTVEVERLSAENRSQRALLEEQHTLKFGLDDCRKKCAEISFVLDNTKSELAREREEKEKLIAECTQKESEALSSAIENARNESAKVEQLKRELLEVQEQLAHSQEDNERLQEAIDESAKVLAVTREEASRVVDLEQQIAALSKQRADYTSTVASLKKDHERYIHEMGEIYEQQKRDHEQYMQVMIQKKIENLAPLQSNQEKVDKLVEYRNDIEKIYSEQTPLLGALQDDQIIKKIKEKKELLDTVNEELVAFNARHRSPSA